MSNQNSEVFNRLKETLSRSQELKLAILFGSLTEGRETKESDIDVTIAADSLLTFEKKMEIITALAQAFSRTVDLIDLQSKKEPVFSQAITKGKMIFCHDTKLYAELMKTVMFNAADFLPYRARILRERRQAWINS